MKIKIFQWTARFIQLKKAKNRIKRAAKNGNVIIAQNSDLKFINFDINGKNNKVIIKKLHPESQGKITILMAADNSKIIIDENFYISNETNIICGQINPNFGIIKNTKILIEKNVSAESINITTYNSNSKVLIGANCLISSNVNIFNTDAHPIYDNTTNKIINKVKDLIIGRHCWIGAGATILKNVELAENCIVGWNAVVAKSFLEPNCALAGNPAKIVKRNINWNTNGSEGYIQNEV